MEEQKDNLKKFKSNDVNFTVEHKPDCVVEYKVKASSSITKQAKLNATRSISKEVSIPGFRKGRAPAHLIEKKFSQPLQERWKKSIADIAFQACQSLAQIPVLSNDSQISFDVQNESVESGAEITFIFETEPQVPDIDIKSIQLEEVKRETVDAKKVESTIKEIQMFFAKWEKISGREVVKEDYVVVDVDVIEKDSPEKALTNARFQVTKEKMADWMYQLVMGMKVGDVKEGVSQPDKNATQKEKDATPPKKVSLLLRSIEKPVLPEIDDSLAEKLGTKSVQEMKENLEKLLNKQADEHKQKSYKNQVSQILLNQYPFELPKTLKTKETQFRIKQLMSDPNFQKKLTSMTEEDKQSTLKEIEEKGEQAIRLFYISKMIIHKHNIHISPNQVHKEVQTPLEAMFSEQSDIYSAKEETQEQKAIAMSRLALSKAEDYIITQAKFLPPANKKKSTPDKAKKTTGSKTPPKKTTPKKKTPSTVDKPKKKTAKKTTPKKKS